MSEEKSSQSMNFGSANVSGVNAAQNIGGNVNQELSNTQGEAEKQLTPAEVVELIAQIETLFRDSDLPEAQKEKALKYLDSAKEEAQETEPNKNIAVTSFQRASKVLKDTNEAFGAGQGLLEKLKPLAETLAPWFGIAAKSLLLM
jgi:hypothetical protein